MFWPNETSSGVPVQWVCQCQYYWVDTGHTVYNKAEPGGMSFKLAACI